MTVRLVVAVKLPSLTFNTTLLAPSVALQLAATLAVIVPLLLEMLLIVNPAGALAVTIKSPAGAWPSLTVAIVATLAALPCCRVSAPPAVIVGAVLTGCTLNAKLRVLSAAQLSTAVASGSVLS